jgi:hypothetical protein
VYIDDLSNNPKTISSLNQTIASQFFLKDLHFLSYFLGI